MDAELLGVRVNSLKMTVTPKEKKLKEIRDDLAQCTIPPIVSWQKMID